MTNAAGWPTRIPARVDDVLVVCAYLIAVLTQNPFPDTDLGWHVAGGLWMLETGKLPTVDPFGAQGSFWLCYSWLAEVVFGFAYRAGGFAGLSALEALLRIAVTASIVRCVRNASRGASPAPGFIQWAS